ncbi:DUF2304 domain-containing protein [Parablautia muri]|uniref:DUF2304 domain-containing protein n=1 Tax=Parablautia muri TaxID=2320879 RepID=A0A9X5BCV0_9FIRM|nr:DUF2304 domain-containing protein [Parablautia muri]NBJ91334.1 DUF2304 domain-containing protein [Parablautia muri]
MSIMLRTALLIVAAFSIVWIIARIRRSKVRLEDTLFWVGTGGILAVLGLFPQVSYRMADALGIISPANFVFLIMICLLFEKVLTLSIIHSQLEDKYVTMAAEMALRCKDLEEQVEELKKAQEDKN